MKSSTSWNSVNSVLYTLPLRYRTTNDQRMWTKQTRTLLICWRRIETFQCELVNDNCGVREVIIQIRFWKLQAICEFISFLEANAWVWKVGWPTQFRDDRSSQFSWWLLTNSFGDDIWIRPAWRQACVKFTQPSRDLSSMQQWRYVCTFERRRNTSANTNCHLSGWHGEMEPIKASAVFSRIRVRIACEEQCMCLSSKGCMNDLISYSANGCQSAIWNSVESKPLQQLLLQQLTHYTTRNFLQADVINAENRFNVVVCVKSKSAASIFVESFNSKPAWSPYKRCP